MKTKIKVKSKSQIKREEARRKRIEKTKRLAEWSVEVRNRDGNKCAMCGRQDHVQAHHILEKKMFPEHMFKIEVGIALCPKHHMFGKFSAHHGSFYFINWLRKNRPEQYDKVLKMLDESLKEERKV